MINIEKGMYANESPKINVIIAAHKLFKDKGYIETLILEIVKESKTSRGIFNLI